MKTLVLANQKGGVGKSAVATLLAYYFAQHGRRTLAIDFDHQNNFAKPLLLSTRAAGAGCSSDQLLTQSGIGVPAKPFVVVPAGDGLLMLERQPTQHTPFARNFRAFLEAAADSFDVCVIDTNPNPDIRVISALASADFILSPLQLNKEAFEGVQQLLWHQRVGIHKIKALLNPKLNLIGLLPTLVEPTPFQRANLVQVVGTYGQLLIKVGSLPGQCACIPKRSAIAEAQANGEVLWEMKKTAARDAWREIEPSIAKIDEVVFGGGGSDAAAH